MQVTFSNAKTVSAVFKALSDARFSMRTPAAIVKEAATPEITEASVMNVVAELGVSTRHRIRDGALLIVSPCSHEDAATISAKADEVVAGAADFELAFGEVILDEGGDEPTLQ